MAEKVIAIKVDLTGTEAQQKKLAKLETEVKKLTTRRTELNKALKAGTISLADYGKGIAKVNTGLKAHRRELLVTREQILGMDGFTKKLGKSFARVGTSIAGAFVGLFAVQKFFQVIKNGLKTITEFEQQMANVKAITGATAEEFSKLEKSAKDLGASTQFTATEVGKLQEEYAKLGFTTQQILDASEATLELATATGSDLAQSAKVAAATINGFRLEAKDTQRIVDVMAKSFTSSALDLNKFEVAMSAVAPVAATVGMSLEETTASLGVLVDAGFDASTSGTALRNILLDTQKAGISVSEAFNKIKSSVDPSSTALDLFGKRGAAVAITLANSTDKTAKFTKELKNAQGAAEAMAKIVGDTLEGDVKRLNSAFEGLILNLGDNSQDAFRSIVQGATDLINTFGDLTKNTHAESEAMEDQRVKINVLVGRITSLNKGTDERKKLINELNAISPTFLDGLDQENISNEILAKRLSEVNKQLVNQIIIKRQDEKINEKAEDQADAQIDLMEAEVSLNKQLLKVRESGFKGINKEIDANKTSLEQAKEFISVLQSQAIRSRSTTGFGVTIESLNEEAKAYDKLVGIVGSIEKSSRDLNNENKEANKLAKERESLLIDLGVVENENSNIKKTNTNATNKNNKATKDSIKTLEDYKQELEEIDDVDPLDNEDSFSNDLLEKSTQDRFDFLTKNSEKLGELTDKEKDEEVKRNAKSNAEQLQQQVAFNELLDSKKIELAQQTANALIDVSNRRIQREKDLELSALDAKLQNELITQEEFEKQREAIERKAFNKQKKLQLAQVAISLATELASINMNAAANPANAFTFGGAGVSQASVLGAIAVAKSAIQAGVIASQKFADGGFTGDGYGSADSTGFKQAGVVHEGEYVVPKHVLDSQKGGQLVGALESMRMNKPTPLSSIGFANGGFTSGSNMDISGLRDEITSAVISSMGAIKVQNVATDTTSESIKVNNIMSEATFG